MFLLTTFMVVGTIISSFNITIGDIIVYVNTCIIVTVTTVITFTISMTTSFYYSCHYYDRSFDYDGNS